jgi:murein DD-endopeptidase MepM/ murein hydrolase activator NlpD
VLVSGYYHIRPSLTGYSFAPTTPNIVVQAGQHVAAGDPIGRSGNAGKCLPPHLHFEVQASTAGTAASSTGLNYIQVDPYGWDSDSADGYSSVPGISNRDLWAYQPLVHTISPSVISWAIFLSSLVGRDLTPGF